MSHQLGVGCGVHFTDKFAARRTVVVVNNSKGNFAYHLVGIDIRVEQRIAQGNENDENQYALVMYDFIHFCHPDLNDVYERFFHYGTYL